MPDCVELTVGGDVVFFGRLATAQRSYMATALASAGHEKLMPEAPTALACLKSALSEEFPTKKKERISIRSVDKGYAVVVEPPKDTDRGVGDDWGTVKATATLSDEKDENTLSLNPYNPELRVKLMTRMAVKRQWMTGTAVGQILVSIIEKLDGVSYRDNGVVYWMPQRHHDEWVAIADIIEKAPKVQGDKKQTMVHSLSVRADQRLLRAVTSGLTEEVTAELESIEFDIKSGSLKEEACLNRLAKANQLLEKVTRYETDMDKPLQELRAAVEKTQAATAWATMQVATSDLVKDAMASRC